MKKYIYICYQMTEHKICNAVRMSLNLFIYVFVTSLRVQVNAVTGIDLSHDPHYSSVTSLDLR